MTDIVVRTASETDLDTVRRLVNDSWRATYRSAIDGDRMENILARRHARELLKRQLDAAGDVFLVAERNGTVVGHAYACHRPDGLYLDRLHVAPQRKGQGIGKTLMEAVFAAAGDGEPVTLEVIDDNRAAIGFYESLGFRVTRRTPDCNGEMGIDALVMERLAG